MDIQQFEGRKRDHIRLALDPIHQAEGLSGLESIHLHHEALPDLNLEEVSLESTCLGRTARTPFYVAGMTAGHADAARINRALALLCQERGWAMGVGSQRRELVDRSQAGFWRELRAETPELTLFANIGLSQIVGARLEDIYSLVESLQASALVVHANALQEAIQPEGTPQFRGGFESLKRVCRDLKVPVVLKETGCGFSPATLARLAGIGLAAVDVSGLGGTHWGRIEGARAEAGSLHSAASATFARWGEPTAESVIAARANLRSSTEIWASGGVRSGLDAAKLVALGAHRVGYAQPALQAALEGAGSLRRWMELQEYELRVALFCTGCASPDKLRNKEKAWKISGI